MTSAEVQKAMDGWRTFAQEYSCDAVDGIGWLIISLGARLANFTDEEEARITLASLRDHAREWLAERCYIVSTIVVGGMVGIGFRRDPADGEVNVSHDTLDAALQAAIRAAGP